MKISFRRWLKTGVAISDAFVEYLLKWPMIPVAFSFMLFHFSWSAVIFVSASLISAICCYLNIHFYQDNRTNEELLDFLEEYDNYEFDKVDLREVVEQYGEYDNVRGLLYQNTLEELGDGYIARIKDSEQRGKRIGGFKAFPRRMFPNIVILPQNVRDLKINGQFMLFHELGHLGINHRRTLDAGLQTIAGLFYIGIVVFGFLPPWYAMSLLIVLAYLWYGSVTVASIHAGRKTGNIEKFADSFAFFMLRNHPEVDKLKESFRRTSAKEKTRESMDYYAWWFKDQVDIEGSAAYKFMDKHSGNGRMKGLVKNGLSNDAVNFNSMLEDGWSVNMIPGRLLLMLLVAIASWFGKRLTKKKAVLLSVMMLGIPLVFLIGNIRAALRSGMLVEPAFDGIRAERHKRKNRYGAGADAFVNAVIKILEKEDLKLFHPSHLKGSRDGDNSC